MALREILIFPDERLRAVSTEVAACDDELRALVEDMFETMYASGGIGLAAPQVGVRQRLVVIDVREEEGEQDACRRALVNPRIVSAEGEVLSHEGCLSVPEYRAEVPRAERITVEASDEHGQPLHFEAAGMTAICIQHELDHLEGRLFIDYLSRLKRERLLARYTKLRERR